MFPSFEDLRNIVSNYPGIFAGLLALFTYIGIVKDKFDSAKELYEMVMVVPLFFLRRIEHREKVKTLRRKQDLLNGRKDDNNAKLETEERQIGKTRRKEVEVWMKTVEVKGRAVDEIQRNVVKWTYWLRPSLETTIKSTLQEVDELLNVEFPNGLTLDVHQKTPFLTQALIDRDKDLQQIFDWLNDPNVSRIGVYGAKGVGKTAVLVEIQSQLSQSSNTCFEHVCWVSAEQCNVDMLQNSIARQVGFDLTDEEDKLKRKAKLHAALSSRRGKCVIIMDDVVKLHIIDEIGIPTMANGCKLVLSTESHRNCRRLCCEKALEIEPLSEEGSMELFRKNQRSWLEPKLEEIMGLILKECEGLPHRLVKVAEKLVGVDDLNEWNCVWRELREGSSS